MCFRLKVTYTVKDSTDTALVTLWNAAALQLVGKTAVQLLDDLPEVSNANIEQTLTSWIS